jgi:hypothetical protein
MDELGVGAALVAGIVLVISTTIPTQAITRKGYVAASRARLTFI